ncbi:MAG: hypothetical protein AB1Z22_00815 [Synechococcaceae cyanobacterium]
MGSSTALPALAEPLRWELVPAGSAGLEAQTGALPMAEAGPAGSGGELTWELVPQDRPVASESAAATDAGEIAWSLLGVAPLPPLPTPETVTASSASAAIIWDAVPAGQVIEPRVALQEAGQGDAWDLPETSVSDGSLTIRGLARGITVNGDPFPDVGQYVPHGFAHDPEFIVSTTFDWVSRTRSCEVGGDIDWLDCADAVAYVDFTPFKGKNTSLGFQWAVQSLSGRNEGTSTFAGQSLGFRMAWNLTPTTGIAFGGEHIVQLDDTTDLGRNFYLVLSQAVPLRSGENPILLVATGGIGSDFYGYRDNGFFETNCLSGNNISSSDFPDGEDCQWGPIGSASVIFGNRVSVGFEWFGFGLGAGVSLRPLRDLPLTLSFYATDFLGNTPSYISDLCTDDPCEPRFYGRATMSF